MGKWLLGVATALGLAAVITLQHKSRSRTGYGTTIFGEAYLAIAKKFGRHQLRPFRPRPQQ